MNNLCQPYNGLIHGPEEFAEGLAIGVTSVFSHTIGGVTGAAGRITGTWEKELLHSPLMMSTNERDKKSKTESRTTLAKEWLEIHP
uniref:VPS13_C domain-containing protein n=1 Tax=Rhabditophanes sp. KR3021 TaxID=114890 RepID=A0AC35TVZ0_9BILA